MAGNWYKSLQTCDCIDTKINGRIPPAICWNYGFSEKCGLCEVIAFEMAGKKYWQCVKFPNDNK